MMRRFKAIEMDDGDLSPIVVLQMGLSNRSRTLLRMSLDLARKKVRWETVSTSSFICTTSELSGPKMMHLVHARSHHNFTKPLNLEEQCVETDRIRPRTSLVQPCRCAEWRRIYRWIKYAWHSQLLHLNPRDHHGESPS